MRTTDSRRFGVGLATLAAVAATALAIVAPAQAEPGHGSASLTISQQAKGKGLSAQGVRTGAVAPATKNGAAVSLPVSTVQLTGAASVAVSGGLELKANGRSAKLTELSIDLSTATVNGKLGKQKLTIFRFTGTPAVDATAATATLADASLRLTGQAAKALRVKLDLESPVAKKNAGALALNATGQPAPAPKPRASHEAAKTVVSGSADWGVLASWRAYVLGQQGPPMSKGTISTEAGATTSGDMSQAAAYFGFPAASGSYEKGLDGAGDRLNVLTSGAAIFKKPFHCINELKMSDVEVKIDGANSALTLGSYYDIGKVNGMTCEAQSPVTSTDVQFATLDVSGVTPTYSGDGETITWLSIPATLTAAGATAFGAGYTAGQVLDPITVSVTTG